MLFLLGVALIFTGLIKIQENQRFSGILISIVSVIVFLSSFNYF
ncbi:DUF3953 domain-containing protein [Evansella halocellulosilytica]